MTRQSIILLTALLTIALLSVSLVTTSGAFAQSQQGMQQRAVTASGLVANNQIQDGKVAWIQGGSWKIKLMPMDDSMTGSFTAIFTMVKPDGTSLHKHYLKNYVSDTVIAEGGELVMMGNVDVYSGNAIKYSQVPVTVHIMGKRILGLVLDNEATEGHFASANEIYGIMTRPGGLDKILTTEGGMDMSSSMKMNDMSSSSSKMPEFGNVKVTGITKDSAMVEGTTSTAVKCMVEYGKNPDNLDRTATDSAMMMNSPHKDHSVMLENLEPNTTYSYRFKATVDGETVYSDLMTFTTPEA